MIRALTSWTDIAAAQAALRDEFFAEAVVLTHSVGFPGGSTTVDIAWHEANGIWGYIDDIESANGPDGAGGRYWNAFGLGDPTSTRSSLSITVEVNPPLQGTNTRVGGIFGREKDGPLCLLHRGTIGGGKRGVGKDLFWREFSGRPSLMNDGENLVTCALAATLGQGTLVSDLRRFTADVARMKASVREGRPGRGLALGERGEP